jgi:hypothetical protein
MMEWVCVDMEAPLLTLTMTLNAKPHLRYLMLYGRMLLVDGLVLGYSAPL